MHLQIAGICHISLMIFKMILQNKLSQLLKNLDLKDNYFSIRGNGFCKYSKKRGCY